jgi:hypothetical protein
MGKSDGSAFCPGQHAPWILISWGRWHRSRVAILRSIRSMAASCS